MGVLRKAILISGQQGSGKTTTANRVVQELWAQNYKAVKFRFADPLYQMHDAVRAVLKRYKLDDLQGIDGPLLQLLGTEWGRNTRGHDIWVRAFKASVLDYWFMNPDGIVVVDDCRFENEFKVFDSEAHVSVVHVRLRAPKEVRKLRAEKWRDNDQHPSETGLDGLSDAWFPVVADTSVESVSSVAGRIVHEIINKSYRTSLSSK